jgi:hypothetical protein
VSAAETDDGAGAFLAVLAALLLDGVLRLDETVGRVTDLVTGTGKPDRELIVTLQAFDRLKQEFEGLGDALSRYADATNAPLTGAERARMQHEVISAITVADLKDRLLRGLQDEQPQIPSPPLSDAELAEVDVDVVF